ncbi:methylmalonyl-CoA mutase family protein [Actomonas aquatica]|uniref:Methylmalonyl-CoA mutase family protein n=1 Tax=Actomonas aquatica TaxID=2866162 RepID=A0ABZ1C8Q5_9BACT|nr:methylmalonyl-CoA mutase family protein [Opitutus sp. WL0086]WRQ88077.1 methylmalonyl-CoA mutase family protein [Opitutus sp. WL0086]
MDQNNSPKNSPEEPLAEALAAWRAQVERDLKGAPFEKRLITRTPEGISLNPLYTRADLPAGFSAEEAPGTGSRVRGTRAPGDTKVCRRLQAINRADADGFNTALRAALMAGQDAVVVPGADLAAQGGWAPAKLEELTQALREVELTAVPVHFPVGASALPAIAMLVAYAEERGLSLETLCGSVAADPIAAAVREGAMPADMSPVWDDVASSVNWSAEKAPGLRTVAVDASVWSDAGANAVQELGLALAAIAENVRGLEGKDVALEKLAAATLVRFGIGPRFFMELAKFRAWRVVLAKLMVALDGDAADAAAVEVVAQTGRWNKTRLDTHVNMLRTTTEGLSAMLGGVDGLSIEAFDTVTGANSAVGERIARNLHVLLSEEFGFSVPADAAGGSWYVENTTDQLARKAWAFFQEVEKQGGLVAALKAGWVQTQLAGTAKGRDRDYAVRRSGLIGTNLFPNAKDVIKDAAAAPAAVSAFIAADTSIAWSNRLSNAVDALRAGNAVATVVGDTPMATEPLTELPVYKAAAPFEAMRLAAADLATKRGQAPTVFFAKMGPVKQHKPRADFSAGFLSVGGFALNSKAAFATAEEAAAAALESGADALVICSTDDTYPDLVPPLCAAVKAAKPDMQIVLAGLPRDEAVQKQFTDAGVDEFIHVRADVPATLSRMLNRIGANL